MGSERKGSDWGPDDRHLDREGEEGVENIEAALKKIGLSLENIVTSRDLGIDMARYELRKPQPPGWQSWMIPAFIRSPVTFFFLQVAQPASILPEHEHHVAQFRIVLSGHVIYNGTVLGSGDWIYTPPGAKYTLSVAMNEAKAAVILYCY